MDWMFLAICFLLVAILRAIKRGPVNPIADAQAAAHERDVQQLMREQQGATGTAARVTLWLIFAALLVGLAFAFVPGVSAILIGHPNLEGL